MKNEIAVEWPCLTTHFLLLFSLARLWCLRFRAGQLEFREHHRWRIKPHFKPGDPIYNDRPASENTVQGLPEKLKGLKLMQILTGQVRMEDEDEILPRGCVVVAVSLLFPS